MNVRGIEITQEQIDVAVSRMKSVEFSFFEIVKLLEKAGVPGADGVSDRAADRLIQRERKAGNVRYIGKSWFPVKQDN